LCARHASHPRGDPASQRSAIHRGKAFRANSQLRARGVNRAHPAVISRIFADMTAVSRPAHGFSSAITDGYRRISYPLVIYQRLSDNFTTVRQ
jgi:hypothetical protein